MASTTLTRGFASFVLSVLRTAEAGELRSHKEVARAVVHLHQGILAEARQHHSEACMPDGLRERMMAHIRSNLTDPYLTPTTVASAMDISLRHAHGVFNVDDHTLARFIRDCRVAAVAALLSQDPDHAPLGHVARRNGFISTDVMTRAFKAVHGVTPSEYREAARQRAG